MIRIESLRKSFGGRRERRILRVLEYLNQVFE